ncbi:glycosyltransferase [Clostridium botulinum]|uniref:glycosyltransferase n=1 Tax=Clostridium botulinum TaxID=1491 RepID=UPI003DA49363
MIKSIKISVVMPVYNSEKYLNQSIESILTQTYKNFEFIIINDGSTDTSLNIIKKYANADRRIKVISRENKGLVYSLNEGLSVSKGEYIARMDADDISLNKRFEKQVNILDKYPSIDILGGNVEVFGNIDDEYKYNYSKMFNGFNDINKNKEDLFDGYTICHPTVMIRKKALQDLKGYNFKYKYSEDIELWFRAIRNNFSILKIEDVILKYRLHENSKSYIEKKLAAQDTFKARLEYINENLKNQCINYLIWGCGNGGISVNNTIKKMYPNFNFLGWIDKFSEGNLQNKKIYKPGEITKIKFDYIFICTSEGKYFAKKYLIDQKFKNIDQFMICYW